jgi:hypothetical protein
MAETSSSKGVIGWGAAAMPLNGWHHSFTITEGDRALIHDVDDALARSISDEDSPVIDRLGTLCSFVVDVSRKKPGHPAITAVAAHISEDLGHPYWWIEANQVDGRTVTSVHRLEAKSPQEAEAAFKEQPPIHMMLLASSVMDQVLHHEEGK